MSKLRILQKRTFPKWQLFGAGLTLLIGFFIVGLSVQLNADINHAFSNNKAVFGKQAVVITKRISAFKTLDKERIYFEDDELDEIRAQEFVTELAYFDKARFKVQAFTETGEDIPGFRTDMFFESVPDDFLDIESNDWHWKPGDEFVPIVVPGDYIDLYNFGFAETQGLPVISKTMVESVRFGLRVKGNGLKEEFRAGIVDFSNEINSILVPRSFLDHANERFASESEQGPSRLLIRLDDPGNSEALKYFEDEGYKVADGNKEQGRFRMLIQMIFLALFIISAIIIVLSISAIVLSLELLLFKERKMISDLHFIGYSNKRIASFYQLTIGFTIAIAALLAGMLSQLVLQKLRAPLLDYLELHGGGYHWIAIMMIAVLVYLIFLYRLARGLRKLNPS